MKALAVLFLVSLLVLSCTGCRTNEFYPPQDQIQNNYNNVSAGNSFFWLTEDVCYYSHAPLYTNNYYALTVEGRESLCSSNSASFAKEYFNGDVLYMLDDGVVLGDGTVCRLHSYNTITREHKLLTHLDNVSCFFVHEDYVYYYQEYDNGTSWVQPFWVYSLQDGTKTQIAPNILQMGVMNNTSVFLQQNEDEFQLYSYDPVRNETHLIGSFTHSLNEAEYIRDFVNFTSDQVILTVGAGNASMVICYNIVTGITSTYSVESSISSLIAFEEYAFMVLTDWDDAKNLDEQQHMVYRICLSNGERTQITTLSGTVNSFVASDEYVYLYTSSGDGALYRYDFNGDHQIVGYL